MTVVEFLRQNDPAKTSVLLGLRREPSDADLAHALEQNPFITNLSVNLEGEQRADWNSLLRVIATRVNLENVKLQDTVRRSLEKCTRRLVRAILQAIQQNSCHSKCRVVVATSFPTDISTFVDNASSITSFCIGGCDMEPPERARSKKSRGGTSAQHKHRISTSRQVGQHQHHSNLRGLEI